MRSGSMAWIAGLAVMALALPVSAQQVWPIPLPEGGEGEDGDQEAAPTPDKPPEPKTAPEPPDEPPEMDDDPQLDFTSDVLSSYAVRQGQIGLGIGILPSLNLTGTLAVIAPQRPGSPFSGSGTYVLALSPQFSYFPLNRVEVGGFAGPLLRHRLRADSGAIPWPELSLVVGAFAAYHYPVTDRVLLIGTVGSAPLVGASGSPDTVGGGVNLSVLGGLYGFGRAGAAYLFNRHFEVRVEGEASVIGDVEFDTGTSGLSISGMTNTGVRLSVHGYF